MTDWSTEHRCRSARHRIRRLESLTDFTEAAAHEYFHAWNEMALRPKGWGGVSYRAASPDPLTWWMEGVTMYYADVISRRAGAPVRVADRRADLETRIADYLDNPANIRISPDSASITADMPAGANGNLAPDAYAQGRMLAILFDLEIHRRTGDQRSLDDAMRSLFQARADAGYTEADLVRATGTACGCDMSELFTRYVRSAHPIDLDGGLRHLGWRAVVTREPARDSAGVGRPDARVFAYLPRGETRPALIIEAPDGAWARAGLRTRDVIASVGGDTVRTPRDFLRVARTARIGDTVVVGFVRGETRSTARVVVTGYDHARVAIVDADPTPDRLRSRALFMQAR